MGAHRAFVMSALSGLNRRKSFVEVPKDLDMDAFQYRWGGEEGYVTRLAALETSLVEPWAGRNDIDEWAISFPKRQTRVDFRYLNKDNSHYLSYFVPNERRAWEETGLAVLYQCMMPNDIPGAIRKVTYARLTVG